MAITVVVRDKKGVNMVETKTVTLENDSFNKGGDSPDWPRDYGRMFFVKPEGGQLVTKFLTKEEFEASYEESAQSPFALRNALLNIFGKGHTEAINKVVTRDIGGDLAEWSFQGMAGEMMISGVWPLLEEGFAPNSDSRDFTVFELTEEGRFNIHKISFTQNIIAPIGAPVIFDGERLKKKEGLSVEGKYNELNSAPKDYGVDTEKMREYLKSLDPQELVDLLNGHKELSDTKYNKLAEFCMDYHPPFITTGTVYSEDEQQKCTMCMNTSHKFQKKCAEGLFRKIDQSSPLKNQPAMQMEETSNHPDQGQIEEIEDYNELQIKESETEAKQDSLWSRFKAFCSRVGTRILDWWRSLRDSGSVQNNPGTIETLKQSSPVDSGQINQEAPSVSNSNLLENKSAARQKNNSDTPTPQ